MNAPVHSADLPVPAQRGAGSSWFLWLGVLFLAYVLSIGPAAKLVNEKILPESAVAPFYAPIVWMIAHFEPVQDATLWYLSEVWRIDIYCK